MIFKNIAHGDYQKRDMYAISLYKIINSLRKIKLKFAVFFLWKKIFFVTGRGARLTGGAQWAGWRVIDWVARGWLRMTGKD